MTTTKSIEQQVRDWASDHHISDYDMDATLAQLGGDTSEDGIYHAVIDNSYQAIGDRADFFTYLRMFGIEDDVVAEKVMEASSFEHDGKLVNTPNTLEAALKEHWYK